MKKYSILAIRVLLALSIIISNVLFVGCGKKGNDVSNIGGDIGSGWSSSTESKGEQHTSGGSSVTYNDEIKKVDFSPMPELNNVTMTQAEMEAAYRPYTDWRIYSIRTTKSTITTPEGCTSWYVSPNGSDKNDGKTPGTAFKSLSKVNDVRMNKGDVVYFECGGLWRGSIIAQAGVTYTSYGEGAKPQFRSYSENAAGKDKWLPTDTPNVYVFYKTVASDVGTIVFNEGEAHGIKALAQGGIDVTTNKEFKNYKDLNKDLHFVYDKSKLYLRSDKGNPSDRFSSIELSANRHFVSVRSGTNNVTVDNLCFKYGGAHGVGAQTCDGLTITNCEFYWIGGGLQNGSTRWGNGVEIYGQATNYRIENCYFRQIYDAAVTFQYDSEGVTTPLKMENIFFINNVMEYCNYGVEYFLSNTESGDKINNINIENNLMWYGGEGLCSQRYNKSQDAHIKSWAHNNPVTANFTIKNNLFALGRHALVETISSKGGQNPVYSNNIYIQKYRYNLGYIGQNRNTKLGFTVENIKNQLNDKTGKYILVKN